MNLKIFDNADKLVISFCEHLKKLSEEKLRLFVALSGGSTPLYIFSVLGKQYSTSIDWNKIHFFWGDERMVQPGNAESNFGLAKIKLFDHINIPGNNIHRIIGETDPLKEAERYSDEIKKFVPSSNGFPKFDLIMLGLGEDGHTASIFPDQMSLLTSEKICEIAFHPVTNQKRITITGTVINNSAEIFFLVTGKSKKKIVSEIFGMKNSTYPAVHIKPVSGKLIVYTDKEAAELIQ